MKTNKTKNKAVYTNDLLQIKSIVYDKSTNISVAISKPLKNMTISFFSAFKVGGIDISNYSDDEKLICYENLSNIFKSLDNRISIVKISKIYNLKTNEEYLDNVLNNPELDIDRVQIFNSYKESLEHFKSSNYQNNYYVVVYGLNKKDVVEKMNDISSKFESASFATTFLSKSELLHLQLDIYNHNKTINFDDSYFEDLVVEETGEILQEALTIEDIAAFDSIKFEKDKFIINEEVFCNIQSIYSFPLSIHYHWLDTLFTTPSSIVLHIDPVSQERARSQIHKSDMNLKTNFVDNKGANKLDNINLEATYNALNELAEKVALGEEQLKEFQIFFINSAYSLEDLKKLQQINSSNASTINAKINNLTYQQFEAFQNVALKTTDNVFNYQQCPDSTLGGGWPFSNSDFNDGNGFVVGSTYDGNVIIMDQFKLNNNRTNHNMMILGSSGSGKSTFSKKLAMYHLAEGNQNIIIDPESEYKTLLKQYGGYFEGSHYVLGGDAETIFNPLHLSRHIGNDDSDDEINDTNDLIIKEHIDWFGNWLNILFPELKSSEIRYIQKHLKILYENRFSKKMEKEKLSELDAKEYPILSDLIQEIEKDKNKDEENILRKKKTFEILNHAFNESKLSKIYNGESNVSLDDNLIIFDVQSIYNDDSQSATRAALYTIITRINNQLMINYRKSFKDRKKIILFIDEAHLLLDKDNPITINFLHRTVKRIRKYNGGVVLTTQNPGDFVDGGDDKKLTNILNNIQYSFILKMKSQDVEAVSMLYKSTGGLTNYEKKNLVRIPKGSAMFNPDHTTRKFIRFYYNELEKRISWANYQPLEDIDNDEILDLMNDEEKPKIEIQTPFKFLNKFLNKLINGESKQKLKKEKKNEQK